MLKLVAVAISFISVALVLSARHDADAQRISYGTPGACGPVAPATDTPANCLPGPGYIYTKIRTLAAGPPS